MKKLLFAMSAVGALAVAAPAAAQYGYQTGYNDRTAGYADVNGNAGIDSRIAQLEARLNADISAGAISRSDERRLRAQIAGLRRLEWQYSRNGLSASERVDLQQRLRSVRDQFRMADRGYGDARYGWNDRGDTRYGNNDAYYDDRDPNRANGYGNTYRGQGGPYEPVDTYCQSRGGVAGVLDTLVGRDNCTTLRVGDRAAANLYGVPVEYQDRYRDGYGYYYRSDGRAIYQIDTRTNTVLRVYDMNR
ncbi:MAG: hypothetical protein QOK17_1594 [Sphingomonadales bacterium]|jgi:hypothetical protein|nr:hypothetical protein [Sphingomonadales bacterium]